MYEEVAVQNVPAEILSLLRSSHPYADTLYAHGMRTAGLAGRVARHAGLSAAEEEMLVSAAFLHDIGKLFVPAEILLKDGPLTRAEFELVQTHPAVGRSCLQSLANVRRISRIVGQHHERIDGKGYPKGLTGDEIDPLARVLSSVDAYVAMTEDRPYRPTLSPPEALAQLRAGAGTQFDPGVVGILHALAGETMVFA